MFAPIWPKMESLPGVQVITSTWPRLPATNQEGSYGTASDSDLYSRHESF